ncbi:hypothetical protein E2P81_ATG07621 [Venturia nashicola]|uniref:Uncharacterized protein n=1 Tax=Venturia nashicola TaxID=86259 RepID=A0A4Z1NYS3_9PEZI|nr:hypothetical protein E6O75_ATG07779 [Venturia nashicola]TLD32131.1 hypothetical protein E2P81_ATG07621 [Venturia nashicola]
MKHKLWFIYHSMHQPTTIPDIKKMINCATHLLEHFQDGLELMTSNTKNGKLTNTEGENYDNKLYIHQEFIH